MLERGEELRLRHVVGAQIGDFEGLADPVAAARVVEVVVLPAQSEDGEAPLRDGDVEELLDGIDLIDLAPRPELGRPDVVTGRNETDPVG